MPNDKEFITGTELMQMTFPPLTMLTDFLPDCALVLVSGLPGSGKTEFLINQAAKASSKVKVLFFCNEGGRRNFQFRLKNYCKNECSFANLIYERVRWPNFADPGGITFFENIINKYKPKAVFLDPGPDAFVGENGADELKEPLRNIYDLVYKYEICLVFSWHPSKDQVYSSVYSARGSTAIPAKSDLVYDLTLQKMKRILILHKMRDEYPGLYQGKRWKIERTENETGRTLNYIDLKEESDVLVQKRKQQELEVLSSFEPGEIYTREEFMKIFEKNSKEPLPESSSKRLLDKYQKSRLFSVVEKGRGPKPTLYRFNGVSKS